VAVALLEILADDPHAETALPDPLERLHLKPIAPVEAQEDPR
jgi:hypothetical protein